MRFIKLCFTYRIAKVTLAIYFFQIPEHGKACNNNLRSAELFPMQHKNDRK